MSAKYMSAKLSVGDVFALPAIKGEPLFGRIMLDVQAQCIKPKRILSSSPLTFFKEAHLVEVSRDEAGAQVVLPGHFVYAVELPRIAHRPVDPSEVDFPWTLSLYGPRPQLYWGELRIPVNLSIPEYRAMEISPKLSPIDTLVPRALYKLRRVNEIDRSTYQDVSLFDPARDDLRDSPHRERIAELVAGRVLDDYTATAAAYGYDLRRFYDTAMGAQELVLCTYCNAPLPDIAGACLVCGEPTGRDAPVSETVNELALEERKPCKACAAPILKFGAICRWCKTRQ